MNASFVKAISEMLGKSPKKGGQKNDQGSPLSADELLARRQSLSELDELEAQQSSKFKNRENKQESTSRFSSSLSKQLNKRLKIAVLHRNFDPTAGGAEHYAVALVESLAHLHEFHIFSQHFNHDWPEVTYHQVPKFFVRPRWLNQLIFATFCARATKSGYDVIHSHENTWSGDVQTVHVMPITHNLFAGKSGLQKLLQWIKVILSPRLLTYVVLEKLRFKNQPGRWFVAVSSNLKRLLEYSMGCASSALITIAPGVNVGEELNHGERAVWRMHAKEQMGLPENSPCVLWVGHDAQKKGLDTALKAFALLPSDYVLVIAGAAKPKEFWAEHLTEKISARVIEKGVMDAKYLQTLYCACDLLIHPTREDTFGMVVLEAMANALPVIVSGPQYCGISSELIDGQSALILSDPDDATELAGKVVLAMQGHMRESLSKKGQAWAKTQDWGKMAELQNTVYTHIAYDLSIKKSNS